MKIENRLKNMVALLLGTTLDSGGARKIMESGEKKIANSHVI